jgi:N-acetylglucosaminyldiphosphoundecaprenol N-acetyl-beta-D-mannosaminyltransferase
MLALYPSPKGVIFGYSFQSFMNAVLHVSETGMIEPAPERPQYVHPPLAILGVPFDNVTTAETIQAIERMVASRQPHYLVTANVDFLVQAQEDVELRRILFDAHLVLCDGTPLVWASRLLGNPLLERVAGADLVPLLLRVAAEKQYRVFFLGATPESSAQAVENLKKLHPTLIIADHYSPPFNKLLEMDHEEIKRRILAAKPDLLFVSLGCPKQEKWIAMHYRSLGVPVSAGVGATIDFLAGMVKRAPLWMQRIGAEWIYRLAQEPRRLFKRYFKDFWIFGWKILAQLWQLQFHQSRTSQHSIKSRGNKDPNALPSASLSARERAGVRARLNPSEPFQLEVKLGKDWRWLKLPERLDLAAVRDDALLVDQVLIDDRHCLLEMDHVQFIDSTGVGMLIRLQKKIRATGRQLVLLAPSSQVQRALALMRLQNFFACAPDFASAQELIAARTREENGAVRLRSPAEINPLLWQGEITAANAQDVWSTTETHLTSKQRSELVIDMSGVRFIDSTGLGLMVRAKKLAQREHVKLEFVHLQPAVQNVVRLARLEEFLSSAKPREFAA